MKLAAYIRDGGYSYGLSTAAYLLKRDFRKGDRINTIDDEGIYVSNNGDQHYIHPLKKNNVKGSQLYVYDLKDFSHHAARHIK